jgi:hypothetical protein
MVCCTSHYVQATSSIGVSKGSLVTTTKRTIRYTAWGDEAGHVWHYCYGRLQGQDPKVKTSLPVAEARQGRHMIMREVGETVL